MKIILGDGIVTIRLEKAQETPEVYDPEDGKTYIEESLATEAFLELLGSQGEVSEPDGGDA